MATNLEILSQLFARVLQGVRVDDPMAQSFMQWAGAVQESAFNRWRVVASSGVRCSLRHDTGALPLPCEHPAAGACTFCQKPVCLRHAAVAMNGNLACLACIAQFGDIVRERVRAPRTPPEERVHGSSGAPAPNSAAERAKHLKTLGLKDPASWDEVKSQYRKLAVKWHPDRATPAKKEASNKKMRELNAAYQWLDAHMRKAAA